MFSGAPGSFQAPEGAPPGSGGPTPGDPKVKLIQQQLVLLLHAHQCQRQESQSRACLLPHCEKMKNVLNHITTCQAYRSCSVSHCTSSREIISHWKHCTRGECPVCSPIKSQTSTNVLMQQNAPVTTSTTTQPRLNFMFSGAPGSSQAPGGAPPGNGGPIPGDPELRQIMNELGFEQLSELAGGPGSQVGGPLSNATVGPNANGSLGAGPGGAPNLDDGGLGQQPSGQQVHFQIDQIAAADVNRTKDWQFSVMPNLRNHLVFKLVQTIFPSSNPQALHDRRLVQLVEYAKRVEAQMFEMSESRSEYYHHLAEKIYKWNTELDEKKQQLHQQGVRAPGPGGVLTRQVQPVLGLQQQNPVLDQVLMQQKAPVTTSTTTQPRPSLSDMRRAFDALGIQ